MISTTYYDCISMSTLYAEKFSNLISSKISLQLRRMQMHQGQQGFIVMTTRRAINEKAPKYIQQRQQQNHNLRSNNKVMLESPSPLNKNKHEERAFSFAAPILWNTLLENVKNAATLSNFKKNLKTHLFQNSNKKLIILHKR